MKIDDIIESVKEDICDTYCKYSDRLKDYMSKPITEDNINDECPECCKNCPLDRL
mgnify:CR=1 FL=1